MADDDCPQCHYDQAPLLHVGEEFEDPEHPEQPEYSDHKQRLCSGNKNAEISRNDREKVNDTVKARGVLPWLLDNIKP